MAGFANSELLQPPPDQLLQEGGQRQSPPYTSTIMGTQRQSQEVTDPNLEMELGQPQGDDGEQPQVEGDENQPFVFMNYSNKFNG